MARILDEYLYLGGLTNKNQIFEATTIRRSRWLRLFVLKRKNRKKHPQPSAEKQKTYSKNRKKIENKLDKMLSKFIQIRGS
jgi:hypothetical protein